jgi:hypothetical protein
VLNPHARPFGVRLRKQNIETANLPEPHDWYPETERAAPLGAAPATPRSPRRAEPLYMETAAESTPLRLNRNQPRARHPSQKRLQC